jgi:hypothetical protein
MIAKESKIDEPLKFVILKLNIGIQSKLEVMLCVMK